MSNRVLVVGGAGYVGGSLVDQLLSAGYDVDVYDSLVYEDTYLKPVNFIYGDVRDYAKLSRMINNYCIVVWLAAIVGDAACATDPFLTRSINYESVKWLVDHYDGKVCYPSTCSVYGINNELITEEAVPNPLSVYAETKLMAEQYILNKGNDNALIFRLGTLYGLGDRFSRIRFDLVANVLARNAASGRPLVVNGGDQWRPLLHVRDVAGAMIFGIQNNISGLFNLSRENCRIRDIAQHVKGVIPDANIKYVDMNFEDARNYRVSSDRYRSFGWRPDLDLDVGIIEIMQLIKQKRIRNVDDPLFSNVDYIRRLTTGGWVR
jgi:nucleoside-diphosphate-sugar epimerase